MDPITAPADAPFVRWQQFWANVQPPQNPLLQRSLTAIEQQLERGQIARTPQASKKDQLTYHLADTTPKSLIRLGRIRCALLLLESESIDAVARKVGYSTTARFRAAFTEATGYTLTEYTKLRDAVIEVTDRPPMWLPATAPTSNEILAFHQKMLAMAPAMPAARANSAKTYAILQDRLAGHSLQTIARRTGATKMAVVNALDRIERRYVRTESSALQTIARLETRLQQVLDHNEELIITARGHSGALATATQALQDNLAALQQAFMSLAVRAEVKGIQLSAEEVRMARGEAEPGILARTNHTQALALAEAQEAVRTLTEDLKASEIARREHMEEARKWRHNYTVATYGKQVPSA